MGYKVSPSSLKIFENCPRCFWLQIKRKISRPSMGFPTLPSGMDRVLKIHFDSFRDKGELPPELKPLKGKYTLFDDIKLLDVWRNNFKGIQWADSNGNTFRGAVDNLLIKSKKLIVLDYKTRGFPLKDDTATHYQDQMNIYNFLLRKNKYKTCNYAYLLFYHPNKVDSDGDVLFNTDLVKVKVNVSDAEKLFGKALKVLSEEVPEAGEECGFCGWVKENR